MRLFSLSPFPMSGGDRKEKKIHERGPVPRGEDERVEEAREQERSRSRSRSSFFFFVRGERSCSHSFDFFSFPFSLSTSFFFLFSVSPTTINKNVADQERYRRDAAPCRSQGTGEREFERAWKSGRN